MESNRRSGPDIAEGKRQIDEALGWLTQWMAETKSEPYLITEAVAALWYALRALGDDV